jgi:hypothetical protein
MDKDHLDATTYQIYLDNKSLHTDNKHVPTDNNYSPIDWKIRLESLKLAYEIGKQRGFGKDLYSDAKEVFELADMNLSYLMRK